MFKISLYHDYCVALHKHINPYSHRIDQSNRTYNLPTPAIRERLSGGQSCRAVLLKSSGLTSESVGEQTGMTHISVNSWVKRFESEGIKGLETRLGRGRKPIMDCSDEEVVRTAIENDRQSVKRAKEAW